MKRHAVGIIAVLLLAGAPVLAQSQFPGDIPDDIRFRLGGIWAFLGSSTTFSTSTFPGEEVNFQKLLGLSGHKISFRGDGYWNFLGSSYFDFGFVSFDQKGSRQITKDIHFGGVTYTAGAQVDSESFSRFVSAAYRYGIIKNESFHLGASLGVSYTTLRADMTASSGVVGPGGPIVGQTTTKEAEINAPVPLIGLAFEAQISGPVSAGASIRGMGASIHPYSGHMIEAVAHVDWFLMRNFGMGAAYEYTTIEIKKKTDTKTVQANYRYDGPRIYVLLTF